MAETTKNILFELLNALFTNKEYVNSMSEETFKQNLFMVNRRLAIFYPLQAQVFNNNKVNPTDVIKFWSSYLYKPNCKYPPKWIYTAGATKSKEKKESKKEISNTTIKDFCKYYSLDRKDVDVALQFFKDEMIAEIKEFESFYYKLLKENTNNSSYETND